MKQTLFHLPRCVMQYYVWTLIILLQLALCVSAANNPVSNWLETVFSDLRKALLLAACVSAGVTAIVVSLLCYIRMSYIRRRELEEEFGDPEQAPNDIPPPGHPNQFNPPPGQRNPFNPQPNPFNTPPEQRNPFDPSLEQSNQSNPPPEQRNPLNSNAPSTSNYPPRSNPIPIPSSRQPRCPQLHYNFDQTDSESSRDERSPPSTQDNSSPRSRGRQRRRVFRARSMSDSEVSRNRHDFGTSRLLSSSSDSALSERYIYMNPRRHRQPRSRRQQESSTRPPGVRHDETESVFSTDERRQLTNRVRATLQHTNRANARRAILQRTNRLHSRQAIPRQGPIAGPSSTEQQNTGIEHSQEITTGPPGWHDEPEPVFSIDGRRLLTNRVRAILQHANRVHSRRAVLQHTDRVHSHQAIIEEEPSVGPSVTSPDNTGMVASGSASEHPAAPMQSTLPQEQRAVSSSSGHLND
ncbi:hypothetical protein EDC04DRAFT_3143973 [Pisolithus marmoratus]|nr:hypothetical protein EDC04DRAFT_3143973 [Pisolithus marmoratus]